MCEGFLGKGVIGRDIDGGYNWPAGGGDKHVWMCVNI